MYNKIQLVNIHYQSGGPENIHQICHMLVKHGFDASIVYLDGEAFHLPAYESYNNPIDKEFSDAEDTLVLIPESINLANEKLAALKHASKAVLWLSIDNSPIISNSENFYYNLDVVTKAFDIKHHFCQSWYAVDFLKANYVTENIHYIGDYVNEQYMYTASTATERKPIVLFSGRKDKLGFNKRVFASNRDILFVQLENLSSDDMIKKMDEAMIYMDFGYFPGKDRMPREAALRGCIVITGLLGASGNAKDNPLPSEFKILQSNSNIGKLSKLLHRCIDDFSAEQTKMAKYVGIVKGEKEAFSKDILKTFSKICKRKTKAATSVMTMSQP